MCTCSDFDMVTYINVDVFAFENVITIFFNLSSWFSLISLINKKLVLLKCAKNKGAAKKDIHLYLGVYNSSDRFSTI